ncbi:MAG: phosphotransferase [Solirubrobacterales bacterium]
MRSGEPNGVEFWSGERWPVAATAWADEVLAASGRGRTGPAVLHRAFPWSAVLRIPAGAETVWLKASAPATAFEVPAYAVLAAAVPDRILTPLAADPERGWLLLPDGGPPLGERSEDAAAVLAPALAAYGRLQRRLEDHVDAFLAAGVPDMRPEVMQERFEEALLYAMEAPGADEDAITRVAALREPVAEWSAELASSPVPPSLDHSDLHPFNILGEVDEPLFFDWGDSSIAHPFAAMFVPLDLAGPEHHDEARDAYLGAFADLAPHDRLLDDLDLARRLAQVARALTWERGLRATRERGEQTEEKFENAALETLLELAAETYG